MSCNPDDVVVITFSGHGSTTHELMTFDADPRNLENTAVPLMLLADWFSRIPSPACYVFWIAAFLAIWGPRYS